MWQIFLYFFVGEGRGYIWILWIYAFRHFENQIFSVVNILSIYSASNSIGFPETTNILWNFSIFIAFILWSNLTRNFYISYFSIMHKLLSRHFVLIWNRVLINPIWLCPNNRKINLGTNVSHLIIYQGIPFNKTQFISMFYNNVL